MHVRKTQPFHAYNERHRDKCRSRYEDAVQKMVAGETECGNARKHHEHSHKTTNVRCALWLHS